MSHGTSTGVLGALIIALGVWVTAGRDHHRLHRLIEATLHTSGQFAVRLVILLLAALVALNFLWLMGFTSFLLGCALFPITLGVWWGGRAELKVPRLAALSLLLVLGYFAHLVSLGLTVLALGLLAILAPVHGRAGAAFRERAIRLGQTASCGFAELPADPLRG